MKFKLVKLIILIIIITFFSKKINSKNHNLDYIQAIVNNTIILNSEINNIYKIEKFLNKNYQISKQKILNGLIKKEILFQIIFPEIKNIPQINNNKLFELFKESINLNNKIDLIHLFNRYNINIPIFIENLKKNLFINNFVQTQYSLIKKKYLPNMNIIINKYIKKKNLIKIFLKKTIKIIRTIVDLKKNIISKKIFYLDLTLHKYPIYKIKNNNKLNPKIIKLLLLKKPIQKFYIKKKALLIITSFKNIKQKFFIFKKPKKICLYYFNNNNKIMYSKHRNHNINNLKYYLNNKYTFCIKWNFLKKKIKYLIIQNKIQKYLPQQQNILFKIIQEKYNNTQDINFYKYNFTKNFLKTKTLKLINYMIIKKKQTSYIYLNK